MFGNSGGDGDGYREDVNGLTPESVATDFDITEEKAQQLLMEMEEEGVFRYDSDGVWRLGSTLNATKFLVKNREYL